MTEFLEGWRVTPKYVASRIANELKQRGGADAIRAFSKTGEVTTKAIAELQDYAARKGRPEKTFAGSVPPDLHAVEAATKLMNWMKTSLNPLPVDKEQDDDIDE